MGVAADWLGWGEYGVLRWEEGRSGSVHAVLEVVEVVFEAVGHVVPAEDDG